MHSDPPDGPADRDAPAADGEPTYCSYTAYEAGEAAGDLPATGEGAEGLAAEVWEALYAVEDPEMPISIVDLGLIYGVEVEGVAGRDAAGDPAGDEEADRADGGGADDGAHVRVDMTLTYTGCPARDMLLDEVEAAAASPDGVDSASVRLVWTPEWNLELVTDRGREDLREFGLSV